MAGWLDDIAQKVLAKQRPGDYVTTANGESLNKVLPQIGQAAVSQPVVNTAPPNPAPVNTNYTIAPSTDPNLVNPPIDRVAANNPNTPSPYIQQMANGVMNPNVSTPDDSAPNKLSYGQLTPDGRITQDSMDYTNLQKTPLPQQNSFLRRLATGVLSGLAHGDTQNGIGGLLGSALGGGAVDAFSPKAEAQQRTNNELAKIGQRLSTNMAMRQQQIAQQTAINKNQGIINTNNQTLANTDKTKAEIPKIQAETINTQITPILQLAKDQKQLTPAMADQLNKISGGNYTPAQWKSYVDTWVNGQLYTRPEDDPRNAINTTVPKDVLKTPVGLVVGNNPDGSPSAPLSVLPSEAVTIKAAQANQNATRQDEESRFVRTQAQQKELETARLQMEANVKNADLASKYADNAYNLTNQAAAKTGEVVKNGADVKLKADTVRTLSQQIAEMENDPTVLQTAAGFKRHNDLVDKQTKAIQDMNSALSLTQAGRDAVQQLKSTQPPPPQRISAPTLFTPQNNSKNTAPTGKTTTMTQVRQYAKTKGISLAAARKHAQDDGYQIQ